MPSIYQRPAANPFAPNQAANSIPNQAVPPPNDPITEQLIKRSMQPRENPDKALLSQLKSQKSLVKEALDGRRARMSQFLDGEGSIFKDYEGKPSLTRDSEGNLQDTSDAYLELESLRKAPEPEKQKFGYYDKERDYGLRVQKYERIEREIADAQSRYDQLQIDEGEVAGRLAGLSRADELVAQAETGIDQPIAPEVLQPRQPRQIADIMTPDLATQLRENRTPGSWIDQYDPSSKVKAQQQANDPYSGLRSIDPETFRKDAVSAAREKAFSPKYEGVLELDALKQDGVTHVGDRPIDEMLEAFGGEETLNHAKIAETVRKLSGRIKEIDSELKTAPDGKKKGLENERKVLEAMYNRRQDEIDSIPLKDRAYNAMASFANSLVGGVADMSDWVATASDELEKKLPDWKLLTNQPVGEMLTGKEARKPKRDELATARFAKWLREKAAEIAPTDPALENEFWTTKVPEGVGSMAFFLGGGVATKSKFVTPMVLGAMSQGSGGYKDAIANGATEDEALNSFLLNTGLGTSEVIPVGQMLKRLNKVGGGKPLKILKDMGVEAFEEYVQEFGQTAASNKIAQIFYDEDRKVLEGAVEAGNVGGVTGALMSLLVSALPGKQNQGGSQGTSKASPVKPDAGVGSTKPTQPGLTPETATEPQPGDQLPKDVQPKTVPEPPTESGQEPAKSGQTVSKPLKESFGMSDQAGQFVDEFVGQVSKTAPINIEVVDSIEGDRAGRVTRDDAGNVMLQISKSHKFNQGDDVVETIFHETSHVVGLDQDAFIHEQWKKLTPEQRAAAWKEYDPETTREDTDLLDDQTARQEWFAFQFARVARGESDALIKEGMDKQFVDYLKEVFESVKSMVREWYSKSGNLTTEELDSKIAQVLGYSQEVRDTGSETAVELPRLNNGKINMSELTDEQLVALAKEVGYAENRYKRPRDVASSLQDLEDKGLLDSTAIGGGPGTAESTTVDEGSTKVDAAVPPTTPETGGAVESTQSEAQASVVDAGSTPATSTPEPEAKNPYLEEGTISSKLSVQSLEKALESVKGEREELKAAYEFAVDLAPNDKGAKVKDVEKQLKSNTQRWNWLEEAIAVKSKQEAVSSAAETQESTETDSNPDIAWLRERDPKFNEKGLRVTAEKVNQAIESGEYNDILRPDNKNARALFTHKTGVKLPLSISGTKEALAQWKTGEQPSTKPTKPAPAGSIGLNKRGHHVVQDENGVRSYIEDGIQVTQSVEVRPDGSFLFDSPEQLAKEFGGDLYLTVEEREKLKPPTKKQDPKENSPKSIPAEKIPEIPEKSQGDYSKKPSSGASQKLIDEGKKQFEGLFAPPQKGREYSESIPADRMMGMVGLAQKMIGEGINTPDGMAKFLDDISDQKARKYATAFWGAMTMADPQLAGTHDWKSIYADIDKAASETPQAKGITVAERVSSGLLVGDTIKRKNLREYQEETGLSEKEVDEWAEVGVVMAARAIVKKSRDAGKSDVEIFEDLIDLYNRQPNLGAKTSESKIQQAYSTPIPLAFVASRIAGINGELQVFEPTGGHGALVIEADPNNTYINELNEGRRERLEYSGFSEVDGSDATEQIVPSKSADRIIANPPFGTVKLANGMNDVWILPFSDGAETTNIDYQIVMRSLDALKDDGRAVFLIGGLNKQMDGNADSREKAYSNGQKRAFLDALYSNYNVIDYFTVSGELYRKQGAGWPIDIIVVDGRGKSKTELPYSKNPRILTSWKDVRNELGKTDQERIESRRLSEKEIRDSVSGGIAGIRDAVGDSDGSGQQGNTGNKPQFGERPGGPGKGNSSPDGNTATGDQSGRTEGVPASAETDAAGMGSGRTDVQSEQQRPIESKGEFHGKYDPKSKAWAFDTLIPKNIGDNVSKALDHIESETGMTVDEYVHSKLGYGKDEELSKFFAAEQIDALAMAIYQAENGAALINGDQTGIGKGRVAAGMIRYTIKQGKVPVFITKEPKLYSAMLEDLEDIGFPGLNPLFTNNSMSFTGHDGKKWKTGQMKRVLDGVAATGELPEGNEVMFTAYSQIQSDIAPGVTKRERASAKGRKQAPPDGYRMKALKAVLAKGNAVLIMDEAHLASGQSIIGWRLAPLLNQADSVLYLSATFAKRPDSMGIYMRTDLRLASGGGAESLIDAMTEGGVPLQQAVSSMLTQSGQYIRRERDFDGVVFETRISEETADRDLQVANEYIGGLRTIYSINKKISNAVDELNKLLKRQARQMNTQSPRLESASFSSKIHNMVSQYLLAIKAEGAAQSAIRAIKEGVVAADKKKKRHKVIVAVQNTMQNPIEDVDAGGYERTFKGLLLHYLDQQRYLKSGRGADAKTVYISDTPNPDFERYSDRSLINMMIVRKPTLEDPEAVTINEDAVNEYFRRVVSRLFKEATESIEELEIGEMPLSPIDAMRYAVEGAGIKTGEITGRSIRLDTDGNIYKRPASESSKAGQLAVMNDFNNGDTDFIVLNASGSTGISLHASEKFERKDPRMMIVVQPHLDINEFMQTLGRIHRSGQVELPYFMLLQSKIPAELRPAAILGKKMASLNANTTSNAKSDVSEANNTVDVFNKYGDEIVHRILQGDPDMLPMLGYEKWLDDRGGVKDLADVLADFEDDGAFARAVTGRMAVMLIDEQQAFWEKLIDDYNSHINYLDEIGQNDLKADELDIKAETIETSIFTPGGDSNSAFDGPSYLELVNAEVGEKPPDAETVMAEADRIARESYGLQKQYTQDAEAAYQEAMAQAKEKSVNWDRVESGWVARNRAQMQTVENALGYVGQLVQLDKTTYGAVVGYKLDDEKLLVPSKHHLIIRVNSGKGTIRMPFSMVSDKLRSASRNYFKDLYDSNLDWASERAIVTGNLLAAYTTAGASGKIISYTTKSGEVKTGIMLPVSSAKALQDARKNRVYIKDGRDLLTSLMTQSSKIHNSENSVELRSNAGVLNIRVPASKKLGGKFWQNPDLNALTADGLFKQVKNHMVAEIKPGQIEALFDKLNSMGETLFYEKSDESGSQVELSAPKYKGPKQVEDILNQTTGTLQKSLPGQARDWIRKKKESVSHLKQAALDDLDAFRELAKGKWGEGADKVDARLNPWKFAHLTREMGSIYLQWLENSTFRVEPTGDITPVAGSKGLMEILSPLSAVKHPKTGKLVNITELWEGYAAAKRAKRLWHEYNYKTLPSGRQVRQSRKEKNFKSEADIDAVLDMVNTFPVLEDVHKEYQQWNKALLDFAEGAGIIDPKARKIWDKADYVPFFRMLEEEKEKGVQGPRDRSVLRDKKYPKQLTGRDAKVAILENINTAMQYLLDESFINLAKQKVTKLAIQDPDVMEKVPYKAIPTRTSRKELIEVMARQRYAQLVETGAIDPTVVEFKDYLADIQAGQLDLLGIDESELDQRLNLWRMHKPVGNDIMAVLDKGKPSFYRVKDPMLMRSILALGPSNLMSGWNTILKPFRFAKRAITQLVTLDPGFFLVANLGRDTLSAFVQSDVNLIPGIDAAKGWYKALNKENPLGIQLKGTGAGGGTWHSITPEKARKRMMKLTKQQRMDFHQSIIDTPAKFARLYMRLVNASENANRYAIAEKVLKKGGSNLEAAFQAKDLMNFTMHGGNQAMRIITETVPFLNARLQGLYKLGRASGIGKGRGIQKAMLRKEFATKGGLIMAATAYLLLRNWDNDDYWELEEWDRDAYYHFWIGGQHFRFPKPFEVGAIFSTIPERMVEYYRNRDEETLIKRFTAMFLETFAMNPTPQLVKPILEQGFNRNFFTGDPILSLGDQFDSPELQYNEFTSESFRELAKSMPDEAPEWFRSPKRLEAAWRSYTGTLGTYVMDAADMLTQKALDYPEKPARDWKDLPVLRSLVGRFVRSDDVRSTKYVSAFYDLYAEINKTKLKIKGQQQEGDFEGARRTIEKNRELLAKAPMATDTYNQLRSLRQRREAAYQNPALSGEQKRRIRNELTTRQNQLAKRAFTRPQ